MHPVAAERGAFTMTGDAVFDHNRRDVLNEVLFRTCRGLGQRTNGQGERRDDSEGVLDVKYHLISLLVLEQKFFSREQSPDEIEAALVFVTGFCQEAKRCSAFFRSRHPAHRRQVNPLDKCRII